jgi:hypothetical protein
MKIQHNILYLSKMDSIWGTPYKTITFEDFLKQEREKKHTVVHEETVIDLVNKGLLACSYARKKAANGLSADQEIRVQQVKTELLRYAAQGGQGPERNSVFKLLQELEVMGIPIYWSNLHDKTIGIEDYSFMQDKYKEYLNSQVSIAKQYREHEQFVRKT